MKLGSGGICALEAREKRHGFWILWQSTGTSCTAILFRTRKATSSGYIDLISGIPLSKYVQHIELEHEAYYHNLFPGILNQFIECIEAIRFIHEQGEKHGDIRRDHIFIDHYTGHYRWIDFDFNYRHRENIYGYDLFGLGNVLVFLVGMGDVLVQDLMKRNHPALGLLGEDDVNIIFHNRIVNLKKVFPYIPDSLNRILMHFSKGANWFYENTAQLLDELGESMDSISS